MNAFRAWARGLIGGSITGAASAGASWLGMAGAKMAGVDVPTLNLKALGIMMLIGALSHTFAWLQRSPLPSMTSDAAPDPLPKV